MLLVLIVFKNSHLLLIAGCVVGFRGGKTHPVVGDFDLRSSDEEHASVRKFAISARAHEGRVARRVLLIEMFSKQLRLSCQFECGRASCSIVGGEGSRLYLQPPPRTTKHPLNDEGL